MSIFKKNPVPAIVFAALFLLPLGAFAQFSPEPCSGPDPSPSDATVQLSLKNGQSSFHQGEIITLQLGFTSRTKKKFELTTATHDVKGRVDGLDFFCIDPASGSDPLADYFGSGLVSSAASDFKSLTFLKKHPFRLDFDLNEWKSLPAGNYNLYVETRRISQVNPNGDPNAATIPLIVRSNPVEFQVLEPDSGWEADQLAVAQKAVDTGSNQQAHHAARVLRFLGTEDATHELARHYWSTTGQVYGTDMMLGLAASPHRDLAVQDMHDAISDPQHPISRDFLRILALLEIESDPQYKLPDAPHDSPAWQEALQKKTAAFNNFVAQHMTELAAAVSRKTGDAYKISMDTLNSQHGASVMGQ
jgi:hypothetical protein